MRQITPWLGTKETTQSINSSEYRNIGWFESSGWGLGCEDYYINIYVSAGPSSPPPSLVTMVTSWSPKACSLASRGQPRQPSTSWGTVETGTSSAVSAASQRHATLRSHYALWIPPMTYKWPSILASECSTPFCIQPFREWSRTSGSSTSLCSPLRYSFWAP